MRRSPFLILTASAVLALSACGSAKGSSPEVSAAGESLADFYTGTCLG